MPFVPIQMSHRQLSITSGVSYDTVRYFMINHGMSIRDAILKAKKAGRNEANRQLPMKRWKSSEVKELIRLREEEHMTYAQIAEHFNIRTLQVIGCYYRQTGKK